MKIGSTNRYNIQCCMLLAHNDAEAGRNGDKKGARVIEVVGRNGSGKRA